VAKVADCLAEKLGREKVLYDQWYDAEFARPNLDEYLADLYLHNSDLIVVFLCKEYDEKKWCGLESRAWRELMIDGKDAMVMFLKLDDADVRGVLPLDGYLKIRDLTDEQVAAKILARLGEPAPAAAAAAEHRIFVARLPTANPLLIGREKELDFMDRAWANPEANFVQIVAAAGTGKTALVDKWFRRHLGDATIFGWSFSNQGASDDRQTSSDHFFAEIIAWLGIEIAHSASIYAKAQAIASRFREERVLLLIDAVEPLQDSTGTLRDLAFKALLQELDTANKGLVVSTTRLRIDIPDDAPRVQSVDLDNLTVEQGAEYLRSLKVRGTDEELQEASREYWNHAMALTLLGTYLADFCDGDVRRRKEIPALAGDNADARRVIAAYEGMFARKPELAILRALGYFDRPAEPAALKLVLPAMDDGKYLRALKRLHDARLILTSDPDKPIDCHPLVREYFAAAAAPKGHLRLYEYYKNQAPDLPDSIEEMTPLFYAVYHGCRANRHTECYQDVYRKRILRDEVAYLSNKLGAFGADLSLLANFFARPWASPAAAFQPADQAWLFHEAGWALRAVGRLAEAIEPLRAGTKIAEGRKNWKNAAIGWSNLDELQLALGNLRETVDAAGNSVKFADSSQDAFLRMTTRGARAHALHQSGDLAGAERLFVEAEQIQADRQPAYKILYSVQGYQYCDLLLAQGKTDEVIQRATATLAIAEANHWLLDSGLDHLSLGRAYPGNSPESLKHLDQAVEILRSSGQMDYLTPALLARGTDHDLEEVFKIASRSGMRLFLADFHLAKGNIEEAEKLINETGYHRRDKELAALKAKKASA